MVLTNKQILISNTYTATARRAADHATVFIAYCGLVRTEIMLWLGTQESVTLTPLVRGLRLVLSFPSFQRHAVRI